MRLLRRQESFNSAAVQYFNELHASIGEYRVARDEVRRFLEVLAARERRMEALIESIRTEHAEIRTSLGVLQQATHNLASVVSGFSRTDRSADVVSGPTDVVSSQTDVVSSQTDVVSGFSRTDRSSVETLSHKYVGFEDAFRGSTEDIQRRLRDYVSIFAGASDVLDIGCGRGEFLSLLRDAGIEASGIDADADMVAYARGEGLDVRQADIVQHLEVAEDASLGGIFMAQVVEHLPPAVLVRSLQLAAAKLRPGGLLVAETINPLSPLALRHYFADLTHAQPLVPETLELLARQAGFASTETRFLNEPAERLAEPDDPLIAANVRRLNAVLFAPLDYALLARTPVHD
jgi:SAM-dependent methyltransferase